MVGLLFKEVALKYLHSMKASAKEKDKKGRLSLADFLAEEGSQTGGGGPTFPHQSAGLDGVVSSIRGYNDDSVY